MSGLPKILWSGQIANKAHRLVRQNNGIVSLESLDIDAMNQERWILVDTCFERNKHNIGRVTVVNALLQAVVELTK